MSPIDVFELAFDPSSSLRFSRSDVDSGSVVMWQFPTGLELNRSLQ